MPHARGLWFFMTAFNWSVYALHCSTFSWPHVIVSFMSTIEVADIFSWSQGVGVHIIDSNFYTQKLQLQTVLHHILLS